MHVYYRRESAGNADHVLHHFITRRLSMTFRKPPLADISQITDYLYLGSKPSPDHIDELRSRNVRLVISMIGERRPPEIFSEPPCSLLWLQTFDTFLTPIPIPKLMKGVQTALPIIREGGSVFTYCAWGRHRSAAMASAILIAMGYPADKAMDLLHERRDEADPHTWYIRRRIHTFERLWHTPENHALLPEHQSRRSYSEFMTDMLSGVTLRLMRL
jgi:hypothetical protein